MWDESMVIVNGTSMCKVLEMHDDCLSGGIKHPLTCHQPRA